MLDRGPYMRRQYTPALAVIVAVAIIALVILFQWNQNRQVQQEAEEKAQRVGEQRLCEVRAKLDGHPESCVYDEQRERWVPKSEAAP
jgi:cytochrome c-type biogenesis protein CcmH/NrfG